MNRNEFSQRTGMYPSSNMYQAVEAFYMASDADKDAFCEAYKKNEGGLAERIQHDADMEHAKVLQEAAKAAEAAEKRIKELEGRLEREQEWEPYGHDGTGSNARQDDYIKLKTDRCTRMLSDGEAKDLLYNEYGFAKEKITIHRTLPLYEVNRHRQLRKVGEIDRAPLYNASDWNYIRFDCGVLYYELYNGNLRLFEF